MTPDQCLAPSTEIHSSVLLLDHRAFEDVSNRFGRLTRGSHSSTRHQRAPQEGDRPIAVMLHVGTSRVFAMFRKRHR